MVENIKRISLAVMFAAMSSSAFAAADIVVDKIDINSGRIGEARTTPDPNIFSVCTDMDNLPYSNLKQEGFEQKIAELIAKDLGQKLKYQFSYDRQGFIRNTFPPPLLRQRQSALCLILIGSKWHFRKNIIVIEGLNPWPIRILVNDPAEQPQQECLAHQDFLPFHW